MSIMALSCTSCFQFPEKKQLPSLQDSKRHSSSPMTTYLLPFLLGILVGGAIVFLAYIECLGGLWACPEQGEVEVLLQVAPDPRLYRLQQYQRLTSQHNSSHSSNSSSSRRNPKVVVSLLPGCPDRPLHLFILVLSAPGVITPDGHQRHMGTRL